MRLTGRRTVRRHELAVAGTTSAEWKPGCLVKVAVDKKHGTNVDYSSFTVMAVARETTGRGHPWLRLTTKDGQIKWQYHPMARGLVLIHGGWANNHGTMGGCITQSWDEDWNGYPEINEIRAFQLQSPVGGARAIQKRPVQRKHKSTQAQVQAQPTELPRPQLQVQMVGPLAVSGIANGGTDVLPSLETSPT